MRSGRGSRAHGSGRGVLRVVAELLGQVALLADLGDDVELRLQPVDRVLLALQDALDHGVGVLHLFDRLLAPLPGETLVAPVRTHLGVDEVLIDRGQLGREDLVESVSITRCDQSWCISRMHLSGNWDAS
jgi:hypothetical protein